MERLSPAVWSWRSQAALALIALDRPTRGSATGDGGGRTGPAVWLGLCPRSGAPRRRTRRRRRAGHGTSRASAELLHSVGADAEHARVLIDLGSLATSAGASREQAIDRLRQGLDLADRCDAGPLARQAHAALVAYGARPRRRRLSGAEALTPMERRVAELAASGLSNRDIAQSLFLSLRTVESHLTSAYRKLQIESRTNIAAALQ